MIWRRRVRVVFLPPPLPRHGQLQHLPSRVSQGHSPRQQIPLRNRYWAPPRHPSCRRRHHHRRDPSPAPLDGPEPHDGSWPTTRAVLSPPRRARRADRVQAEIHARSQGQVFVGLYVGNKGLEETGIPATLVKVADALRREFMEAIVLVVSRVERGERSGAS